MFCRLRTTENLSLMQKNKKGCDDIVYLTDTVSAMDVNTEGFKYNCERIFRFRGLHTVAFNRTIKVSLDKMEYSAKHEKGVWVFCIQ